MRLTYKSLVFVLASALLAGCKDFVDIKTQGNLVPNEVINYRYLLNNSSNFTANSSLPDFASSDIDISDAAQQSGLAGEYYSNFRNAYTWQSVIYPLGSSSENDLNWNGLYSVIMYCNTIINEVPGSIGTEAEKVALLAEAKVHRADAYVSLLNSYAKPYNASTASTDPGVPLLVEQTVSQSLNRASVQAVYDLILKDLLDAIPSLPETQQYTTLPVKASAYGELARVYLLLGDYANANTYADLALASRSTLNDLSVLTAVTTTNYPRRIQDPEILLSKLPNGGTAAYTPTAFRLSDEYLQLLGTKDQRYTLFTVPAATISTTYTGRYFYKERAIGDTRNEGPSVPEMMLIKAEYFARNNDAANAMLWVNKLRVKRFKPEHYVAKTATSANDALVQVVNERRIEFFGTALRWVDMRRLKDDALFRRTYTRQFNGQTYTLDPSSNRYVFPIAESLRRLNPEIEQNP